MRLRARICARLGCPAGRAADSPAPVRARLSSDWILLKKNARTGGGRGWEVPRCPCGAYQGAS
eukprot:1829523-Alexandrium_andersonii.AAC.1